MNTSKSLPLIGGLFVLLVSATVLAVVEMPVVVNVLKGVTFSQQDADKMVENMNKNLGKTDVKFVRKGPVHQDVNVGNGDGNLDINERNEARKKGRGELEEHSGGKGIKIYIANEPNAGDPNCVGWACDFDNVIFVKPDAEDPNETGITASHEATHAMTVRNHSMDPNDLMCEDGFGTNLRPSDINEIKYRSPKWGIDSSVKPADSNASGKAKDCGKQTKVRGMGLEFDDFEDTIVTAGDPCLFAPDDPSFRYIDVEHIILACENPTVSGAMVNVEIFPGGMLPDVSKVDSFFDVYFEPDPLPVPAPETSLQIHIWRNNAGEPLMREAKMLDHLGTQIATLSPPEIIRNVILDLGPAPKPYNDIIQCQAPLGLIASRPEPLVSNVNVHAHSRLVFDERIPGVQAMDETNIFSFNLENPAGPSLKVIPATTFASDSAHWVFGSGFKSFETVTILMTSEANTPQFAPLQNTVTTDMNGSFKLVMSPGIAGGLDTYSVVAVGTIAVNSNIRSALGYFTDYPLPPDIDNDNDVDFLDFAIFADYWLYGK